MANANGTASGYIDLLNKFRQFLVDTCGWTQLVWTAGPPAKLVVRAPGALAGHEFFLMIETDSNPGAGAYGWRMRGSIDYDNAVPFNEQLMASPPCYFNTWANDIPYWFYGNGRHAKIGCKVNTSYLSMYAGLFLPFALPTEYLKPFYIAGNYPELAAHDFSNTRNRFIADPGQGSAYYLNSAFSAWKRSSNHIDGTTEVNFEVPAQFAIVWPHRTIGSIPNYFGVDYGIQSWNRAGLLQLRPNKNGEMPIFLCHLMSAEERKMLGVLEGVYATGGFGRTSEQILTLGSKSFRLFQNVFRTTGRDYMAFEVA